MSLDGHAIHDPDASPILTESLALAAGHYAFDRLKRRRPELALTEADWEAFRSAMKQGMDAGMNPGAREAM